jgi:autotransporter-associated beta strand protein
MFGSGDIVKQGSGTVTLSGQNNYIGDTNVAAGTLLIGASGALSPVSNINVSGGTLDLGALNNPAADVTLVSGAIIDGTLSGTSYTTQSGSISADLAGTGGLTQNGAGTTILSGNNSYSGPTLVTSGNLNLQNSNALGGTSGAAVTGGSIQLQGGVTVAGVALSIAGTGSSLNGALESVNGDNARSGLISLASDSTIGSDAGSLTIGDGTSALSLAANNLTLAGGATANGTVNGTIAGTTGGVTISGGNWTFNSANSTYTGGTTFNGGTAGVSVDSDLGAVGGTLTFGGGTLQATSSFSTARAVTLAAGGGTIAVSAGNTLTASGDIGGSGSLTKADSGTLVLTGSSSYGGGTTVSAGTLQGNTNSLQGAINVGNSATLVFDQAISGTFNGTLSGTGPVTLQNTGTLTLDTANTGYTGTMTVASGTLATAASGGIGGNLVVSSGGIVAPGGSGIGELSVGGSLTANDGSIFDFNLSGPNSSSIGITGGAMLNGIDTINVAGSAQAGTYTLMTFGGSETGTGSFVLGSPASAGGFIYALLNTGSAEELVVTQASAAPSAAMLWDNSGPHTLVSQVTDGSGTWSNGSASFFNTTADAAGTWDNTAANSVTFGTSSAGNLAGAGGVVTLGSDIVVGGSLTFATVTSPYTIAPAGGYSLTVDGGITADNSATINAPMILGASQIWTVAAGQTLAIGGDVSETASGTKLTLNGPGVVALTGNNSYTGGTIMGSGVVVQINNLASLGTVGTATINNATLEVLAGNTLATGRTFVLGSTSSTIQVDAGSLYTLNGTVSGLGTLNVAGTGTLAIGSTGSVTSTNINVAGGANFSVASGGVISNSTNLVDSGTVNFDNAARTIATLNGSGLVNLAGASGTAMTVSAGGTFSGSINDGGLGGSLAVTGGTLNLSGANSYTGTTSIASGALVNLSGAGTLGTGVATVAGGGTLELSGVSYTSGTPSMLNLSGTGTIGQGALLTTGTTSYGGAISVATDATISTAGILNLSGSIATSGSMLTLAGGGTFNVSGGISGSAANTGLVVSASTLVLSGTQSSYDGPTSITGGGTLQLGASFMLPNSPATDLSLSGTSTFDMAGFSDAAASLAGNGLVTNSGAGASTLGLVLTSGTETFNGVIADGVGGLSLNVSGTAGTQILTGTNTYTGSTTISGGTLALGAGGSLASTSVSVGTAGTLNVGLNASLALATDLIDNGSVAFSNSSQSLNTLNGTNASASLSLAGTALAVNAGGSFAGNLDLGAGSLTINGNSDMAVGGVISDDGAGGSLTVNLGAANTLTLASANTYVGGTTINTGTVQLNVANGLAATGVVAVNSTSSTSFGTLELNSNNLTVGGLQGFGRDAQVQNTAGSGPATLTFNIAANLNTTYAGHLSDTAATPLSIDKQGAGTQQLGGESLIHGGVTVDGGTLRVQGTLDDSLGTGIVVNSGGTLNGTGTIIGNVTINGSGVYSPGNSPGAETITNLTLNTSPTLGGSDHPVLEFDVNTVPSQGTSGVNWDLVNVTNTLTINSGPITFTIDSKSSTNADTATTGFNANGTYQWDFINYGNFAGTFNSSNFTIDAGQFLLQNPGAIAADFSIAQVGNSIYVDYGPSAVPEPGSMVLAGIAALGAAGYGWRRRKIVPAAEGETSPTVGG